MSTLNHHNPPSAFQRNRPASRRTASSYDVRLYETTPLQHHHRSTSSSALPFARTHAFARPVSPVTPPSTATSDPRFSRLFSTVLGSPFLTTTSEHISPLEMDNIGGITQHGPARPASPALTADFSIIDVDDDAEPQPFIPGSYPTRFLSTSMASLSFSRGRTNASNTNWNLHSQSGRHHSPTQSSLKSFIPRLWEAISSPSRGILSFSTSTTSPPSSRSSSRTASPSASPRPRVNQSWYINNGTRSGRNSPVYWNTGSSHKGKGKNKLLSSRNGEPQDKINYLELPPLDGEEGELIDDEACFIDSRAINGIDILSLLPPELALHVLSLLCPPPIATQSNASSGSVSSVRSSLLINESASGPHEALRALLSCRLVSRSWCRLASDNGIWRMLYLSRWNIDLRRAANYDMRAPGHIRRTLGRTWDLDLVDLGPKAKRVLGLPTPVCDAPIITAPLRVDWRLLCCERLELDKRWIGARHVPISARRMGGIYDVSDSGSPAETAFEPTRTQIPGHFDSVYCLEFDSRRIITGSRDRTIKIWSLQTGKLLGTLVGVHRGSVLCLKFEKDWDRDWEYDSLEEADSADGGTNASSQLDSADHGQSSSQEGRRMVKRGFMVSGSSDCSVCVWDLHLGAALDQDDNVSLEDAQLGRSVEESDREVTGEVRQILKGHVGGVLDLRIDKQWIVSSSKDAVIRIWDRKTLELHRTLRGHEGPVNAVGLQSGKVVSASGDGKMILWDIESGERLRTFEGHDRGLACIEFKDDLIVSGSNDCKIKVWSASTGDCLRTLAGHRALVRALSFDPRNGRLVSASYDKTIKLWDLSSGKLIREFKDTHTSHIFDVKFDICRIVSTSHDQIITVLDFSVDLDTSLFV